MTSSVAIPVHRDDHQPMGEFHRNNLAAAKAFYHSGPAATDQERREFFAADFVWHVPGDTDLSGPYAGEAYFTEMPARMQPLEEWSMDIEHFAANEDLVVAVGRIRGRRLGRVIDTTGGHIFRFDSTSKVAEAWGWCAEQRQLDAFFGGRALA
jgi:ketosteroid isomerase-like protein